MVIHNFDDERQYSEDLSHEPIWREFYCNIWPTLIQCNLIPSGASQWQRTGIDREIKLANGKQYMVDEKKRRTDYGDIGLEFWSVWRGLNDSRNKLGWARDPEKRSDFVAYAIIPIHRCYLLPTELLRLTFERCGPAWVKRFPVFDSKNQGYLTRNVGVPWDVLSAAMTATMHRPFAAKPLPLKATTIRQLAFPWGI